MGNFKIKYLLSVAIVLLFTQFVFGFAPVMRAISSIAPHQDTILQQVTGDSTPRRNEREERERRRNRDERRRTSQEQELPHDDSVQYITPADSAMLSEIQQDIHEMIIAESDSARSQGSSAIDKPISGKAMDSLYYDLRTKRVYLYTQGDVTYGNFNLKADFMDIDLNSKNIYAYGSTDTVNGEVKINRPTFTEGGSVLNMDTITYNITSQKA